MKGKLTICMSEIIQLIEKEHNLRSDIFTLDSIFIGRKNMKDTIYSKIDVDKMKKVEFTLINDYDTAYDNVM